MNSQELLTLFELPSLFGGTYGMRFFYHERKCGSSLYWMLIALTELCLCMNVSLTHNFQTNNVYQSWKYLFLGHDNLVGPFPCKVSLSLHGIPKPKQILTSKLFSQRRNFYHTKAVFPNQAVIVKTTLVVSCKMAI